MVKLEEEIPFRVPSVTDRVVDSAFFKVVVKTVVEIPDVKLTVVV